jgi:hypothetical protein
MLCSSVCISFFSTFAWIKKSLTCHKKKSKKRKEKKGERHVSLANDAETCWMGWRHQQLQSDFAWMERGALAHQHAIHAAPATQTDQPFWCSTVFCGITIFAALE